MVKFMHKGAVAYFFECLREIHDEAVCVLSIIKVLRDVVNELHLLGFAWQLFYKPCWIL